MKVHKLPMGLRAASAIFAVALLTAWISGVALLDNQTANAAPFGARAKYIWPTLVSPPDRTTGGDHAF